MLGLRRVWRGILLLLTATLLLVAAPVSAGTSDEPEITDPADAADNDVVAAWFEHVPERDVVMLRIRFAVPPLNPHQCPVERVRESHYFSIHFQMLDETSAMLRAEEADANFTHFRFIINRICDQSLSETGRTFTNVGMTDLNRTRFLSLGRANQSIDGELLSLVIEPTTLRMPFKTFLDGYQIINLLIETDRSSLVAETYDDRAPDAGYGKNMTIGKVTTAPNAASRVQRVPRAVGAEGNEGAFIPGFSAGALVMALATLALARGRERR